MNDQESSLLSELEEAVTREAGERLLWQTADELTDDIAVALLDRAESLRSANDLAGFEEYKAWADLARSLVTLREIRSTDPGTPEQARQFLKSKRSRFDDAFIQLLSNLGFQCIGGMMQAEELRQAGDPEAADAARHAAGKARFEVMFLNLVADASESAAHRAQAQMAYGTFLLTLAQQKEADGEDAKEIREQARAELTACAGNPSAPASLRAQAEGNLAAVAGAANPDLVDQHQAAAQRFAEEAGDLGVLRKVRRDRAFWAKKRNDWRAAYDLYQQNLEDTERALWYERSGAGRFDLVSAARPDYEALVEVCLELAKEDPSYYERALEFVDQGKARAFLSSLAEIASSYSAIPPRLTERRQRILQRLKELGDLQKNFSTDVAELYQAEMEMMLQALGTTEAQIARCATRNAWNLKCMPLKFEAMQAIVPSGSAILSYFSLPDRMLIFVLTEHGLAAPPAEVPLSREELVRILVNLQVTIQTRRRNWVEAFEKQLGMRPEVFLPANKLEWLHRRLIEPVQEHLAGRNLLYIVPHGHLRSLPFHAFQKEDGNSLIDDAAVAYAPSLAVLRHCLSNSRADLKTCYAAGVPKEKGGPTTARDEAATVAGLFGATPGDATRDAVLQQAGRSDVVHLACHGDVDSAITSFQGLLLEDGTLYQQDIAGMDCRASLVVLSACETGRGDLSPGHEMAGLIGAFIRAGAPSVVASLWPVAVRSSGPLMKELYTALKEPGVSKAEALRRAQTAVKAQEGFSHPYFWAAFSLWGSL